MRLESASRLALLRVILPVRRQIFEQVAPRLRIPLTHRSCRDGTRQDLRQPKWPVTAAAARRASAAQSIAVSAPIGKLITGGGAIGGSTGATEEGSSETCGRRRFEEATAGSGADRKINAVMNSVEADGEVGVRNATVKITSPPCNATTAANAMPRRRPRVFGPPTPDLRGWRRSQMDQRQCESFK